MKQIRKTSFVEKVALFMLIFLPSTSALAWGPERPLYTLETPADYAVFNSISDNLTIGDERNFVRIAEINTSNTGFKDEIEIIPGREYLVYIYFHNNA